MKKKDIFLNILFPLILIVIPNIIIFVMQKINNPARETDIFQITAIFSAVCGIFSAVISVKSNIKLSAYFKKFLIAAAFMLCTFALCLTNIELFIYIPPIIMILTSLILIHNSSLNNFRGKLILILLNPNIYFSIYAAAALYCLKNN